MMANNMSFVKEFVVVFIVTTGFKIAATDTSFKCHYCKVKPAYSEKEGIAGCNKTKKVIDCSGYCVTMVKKTLIDNQTAVYVKDCIDICPQTTCEKEKGTQLRRCPLFCCNSNFCNDEIPTTKGNTTKDEPNINKTNGTMVPNNKTNSTMEPPTSKGERNSKGLSILLVLVIYSSL